MTGVCCDLHGRHCEPPSELCCWQCTEAAHDTFPTRHADGSPCVLDELDEIADAITRDTLRPALAAAGVADPDSYAAAFDRERMGRWSV